MKNNKLFVLRVPQKPTFRTNNPCQSVFELHPKSFVSNFWGAVSFPDLG